MKMDIVICNNPCENDECPHHPGRMLGHGEEYPTKDFRGTEECKEVIGGGKYGAKY